jgi:1,3-beta-glucanosyltransferase GAS1
VIDSVQNNDAAPYVKAAASDMRLYRDFMGYRPIPIGVVSANLTSDNMFNYQNYLSCGGSESAIDFFAYNIYSWCGSSSFVTSGYEYLYSMNSNISIPIFFAETGCNNPRNRQFGDLASVLGSDMNDVFSGAIVYEWTEEVSDYGLVSYTDTQSSTGTPVLLHDYTALKNQWATLSPIGVKSDSYKPTLSPPPCPDTTQSVWQVDGKAAVPTLGSSGLVSPSVPRTTSASSQTGIASAAAAATKTSIGEPSGNPKAGNEHKQPESKTAFIVGIVIGAVVIICILLGVFIWWRRRRNRKTTQASDKEVVSDGSLLGKSSSHISIHEMPANRVMHELSTKANTNEMPGARVTHELSTKVNTSEMPVIERGHELNIASFGTSNNDPMNRNSIRNLTRSLSKSRTRSVSGERSPSQADRLLPAQPAADQERVQSESIEERPKSDRGAEPSPLVKAQRQLELEWLENEEARIRERRARLMAGQG